MTIVGNDITITIDGTDYTNKIISYSESGGEKQVKHIRTMGNTYKSVITGRSDYLLSLTFKHDSIDVDALFEDDTGIDISIALGSDSTISYSNMIPQSYQNDLSPSGAAKITIDYSASPYDSSGNLNKEVA